MVHGEGDGWQLNALAAAIHSIPAVLILFRN